MKRIFLMFVVILTALCVLSAVAFTQPHSAPETTANLRMQKELNARKDSSNKTLSENDIFFIDPTDDRTQVILTLAKTILAAGLTWRSFVNPSPELKKFLAEFEARAAEIALLPSNVEITAKLEALESKTASITKEIERLNKGGAPTLKEVVKGEVVVAKSPAGGGLVHPASAEAATLRSQAETMLVAETPAVVEAGTAATVEAAETSKVIDAKQATTEANAASGAKKLSRQARKQIKTLNRQLAALNGEISTLQALEISKVTDKIRNLSTKQANTLANISGVNASNFGWKRAIASAKRWGYRGIAFVILIDVGGHVYVWYEDEGDPSWVPGINAIYDRSSDWIEGLTFELDEKIESEAPARKQTYSELKKDL